MSEQDIWGVGGAVVGGWRKSLRWREAEGVRMRDRWRARQVRKILGRIWRM